MFRDTKAFFSYSVNDLKRAKDFYSGILGLNVRESPEGLAIDLAGHTGNSRLSAFAIKPAAVTATWLGYAATTGLATIDWRITDARVDPPGQEAFHSGLLPLLSLLRQCHAGGSATPGGYARHDHVRLFQ